MEFAAKEEGFRHEGKHREEKRERTQEEEEASEYFSYPLFKVYSYSYAHGTKLNRKWLVSCHALTN